MLNQVAERALPSAVLPEQVNLLTSEYVSVSPLVWSHAELVIMVQKFMDRFFEMQKCPYCSQSCYREV